MRICFYVHVLLLILHGTAVQFARNRLASVLGSNAESDLANAQKPDKNKPGRGQSKYTRGGQEYQDGVSNVNGLDLLQLPPMTSIELVQEYEQNDQNDQNDQNEQKADRLGVHVLASSDDAVLDEIGAELATNFMTDTDGEDGQFEHDHIEGLNELEYVDEPAISIVLEAATEVNTSTKLEFVK